MNTNQTTIQLAASALKRQPASSDYRQRLENFISELRIRLNDGQWHVLPTKRMCWENTVSNNLFLVLLSLQCVERRKSQIKSPGIAFQYRALSKLGQVSVSTVIDYIREYEKSRPVKSPAKITAVSPVKPKKQNQFLLVTVNDAGQFEGGGLFESNELAAKSIADATVIGKAYVIAQIVEVITPVVELRRSTSL